MKTHKYECPKCGSPVDDCIRSWSFATCPRCGVVRYVRAKYLETIEKEFWDKRSKSA